ncbi:MAG: transcriptional regulator, partial [Acidimicrobiia bacterium]|nr:transcriptional regulator [Acidimicrobiia bacterium]
CYSDPGDEPDVNVQAESLAFVDWHRGKLNWSTAVEAGQIIATGRRDVVRALPTWNSHQPTLTRT